MNRRYVFAVCVVMFLLVGCGSAAPRQIASFPAEPRQVARAPVDELTVYNASFVMATRDAGWSADQAGQIAYDLGGYQVTRQAWNTSGQDFVTVELAVPSDRFEDLRRSVLGLGHLVSERIIMDQTETWSSGRSPYSHLTIQFQSDRLSFSPSEPTPWYPWSAFTQAFKVLSSIFSFLLYILIWLLVLGSPIAVIVLVVYFLLKRVKRTALP